MNEWQWRMYLRTTGNIKTPTHTQSTLPCTGFSTLQIIQPIFKFIWKNRKIFSLVCATVHSLLSSFAGLHQRHSSALDSTEKKILHFSDGKNKLCPHNFHPLEKHPKVHRFSITLVACLFYVFTILKQSCKRYTVHHLTFPMWHKLELQILQWAGKLKKERESNR